MIASRLIRTALVVAVAVGTIAAVAPSAGAASQTYTVKVDGQPPTGEPCGVPPFLPGSLHQRSSRRCGRLRVLRDGHAAHRHADR